MPKAVVRKIKGSVDPQLKECFLQLTGEVDPPQHVIEEKNRKLRVAMRTFAALLERFSSDEDWRDLFGQNIEIDKMGEFAETVRVAMGRGNAETSYKDLKGSDEAYKIAETFLYLGKTAGKDLEEGRDQFVRGTYGKAVEVLKPLCAFKLVPVHWIEFPEPARKAFLEWLKKILRVSGHVRHVMVTPDADVDDVVDAILKALDMLQKRKPRCKKVFHKIREAADMLRDNFDTYYERFLRAGKNSTVICTSFLDDIVTSQKEKMDARLLWEFKELKKLLESECQKANMDANPMAKKLLKIMDETIDAAAAGADEEEDEDDEE